MRTRSQHTRSRKLDPQGLLPLKTWELLSKKAIDNRPKPEDLIINDAYGAARDLRRSEWDQM